MQDIMAETDAEEAKKAEADLIAFDHALKIRQEDRAALRRNEAFTIGILQAVSGAALLGALSQYGKLHEKVGPITTLIVTTGFIVILIAAVVSALCRHHYLMWSVKGTATREQVEKVIQADRANKYLKWMRRLMVTATVMIGLSFGFLILALWKDRVMLDTIKDLEPILQWSSVIAALLAAFFWLRSARVELPQEIKQLKILDMKLDGDRSAIKNDDLVKLAKGLAIQSRYSAYAAGFACLAATVQGSLLIPIFD